MLKPDYKKEYVYNLVKLAQTNDIKALEELVKRVQRDIYALFSYLTHKRNDISDLTQETLLKMRQQEWQHR